jgi:hypothetical protein
VNKSWSVIVECAEGRYIVDGAWCFRYIPVVWETDLTYVQAVQKAVLFSRSWNDRVLRVWVTSARGEDAYLPWHAARVFKNVAHGGEEVLT